LDDDGNVVHTYPGAAAFTDIPLVPYRYRSFSLHSPPRIRSPPPVRAIRQTHITGGNLLADVRDDTLEEHDDKQVDSSVLDEGYLSEVA